MVPAAVDPMLAFGKPKFVVQSVEKLRAELQPDTLGDPEILIRAQVPRLETRPDQYVAAGVAEGVCRDRSYSKSAKDQC